MPDVFWGARAVPRAPRWTEPEFFAGRPRPPGYPSFLAWASTGSVRFAAVLVGLGFWGVFVNQLYPFFALLSEYSFLLQLVVGAPVFEEMFKFGLALFLVSPLGGLPRLVVLPLRLVVAAAVGLGFGAFEHWFSYPDEDSASLLGRLVFHCAATTLSMAAFAGLEPVADTRVRWAATVPASLVHYGNNAFVIPVALAFGETAAGAWSWTMTGLAVAAIPVLLAAGRPFATWVHFEVQRRLV
jgi:RsiW-degrading membrane proteinase PrsW (M82 family)